MGEVLGNYTHLMIDKWEMHMPPCPDFFLHWLGTEWECRGLSLIGKLKLVLTSTQLAAFCVSAAAIILAFRS